MQILVTRKCVLKHDFYCRTLCFFKHTQMCCFASKTSSFKSNRYKVYIITCKIDESNEGMGSGLVTI